MHNDRHSDRYIGLYGKFIKILLHKFGWQIQEISGFTGYVNFFLVKILKLNLKKKNDIIQRVSGGVSIKIRKFESTEECKLINEPFWLKSEFRNVY